MSDSNEIVQEINKVTSVTYNNEVNGYFRKNLFSKAAMRSVYYCLVDEAEEGKLEKDSVQERYFELVAQENDREVDEIKHIYDNYVSNDKIEFFKGYTREHTNDMLGRERSYLETATFTLGENELVMVKADNVPNKPKNDFNKETITIPFEKINEIKFDSNQHAFKYPQINVKTDDEVYEVIGLGPKWLKMFYNALNDAYNA